MSLSPRSSRPSDRATVRSRTIVLFRQRDVDVQSARARRLRHAGNAEPIELVLDPARHVEHLANVAPSPGSRSIAVWSWRQRIGDAREPRILRNRRQLRHVEERRQRSADQPIAWALLVGRLDVSGQHFAAHARRAAFRVPLLVERGPVDAVRKPLHHQRPVVDAGQQERRRLHVVADQLALGDAELRPEHLRQIRDAQRVAVRQR